MGNQCGCGAFRLRLLRVSLLNCGPQLIRPGESTRVNSIGYTTVELHNLFRLAQISRAAGGGDLFAYTSRLGGRSSIRGALDFLVPYALGQRKWPHRTETTTWAIFQELRMASQKLPGLGSPNIGEPDPRCWGNRRHRA